MKSIFRTIALLVSLLATVSCNIDFLYIQLPDTSWFYELGETQAWIHFGPGDRVTIVQSEPSSGKCQYSNGTWTASGHSVMITEDGGASRKFTRTFSHLKNSKNKNFSRIGPEDAGSLSGTVWTAVRKDSLLVLSFGPGTRAEKAVYKGISPGDGSWTSREEQDYALTGSHVALEGGESATFYGGAMLYGDVWAVPVKSRVLFIFTTFGYSLEAQTESFPFTLHLEPIS